MSTSSAVFVKQVFAAGVPQRFVATSTNTLTECLQWVQLAGAAAATIVIYASALAADNLLLTDTDPATNPYWSLTPMVFDFVPGGVRSSDILPMADIGVASVLVEITADGPLTLSMYAYQISAAGS